MSDKNQIEFRVQVTDEGLGPLASKVGAVDRATDGLGKSATTAGQKIGGIDATAAPALEGVNRRGRKAAEGIDSISVQLQRVQNGLIALGVGGSLVNMIKGVAETADGYGNLAARIKLATGEGEAFERAFERVNQIALDTNSSLEGTGDLFARLTDAGKSAGLGTQEAITQALSLTESINQAVQVSGASAQASDAALRQLIQGLQGGALRGDEFNSVMEQSPRLAKALADGLGVTTGQLRTMANEGRLTSDVVIQSLKSQADTLKREFETLPATVERSVQNLSTAWTVYVGNADKASGASRTAAQAIDVLADNLDTLAGYLIDAGQAAAAFAALRLAQTFTGLGTAATASAVGIAANATAMRATSAAASAGVPAIGRFAGVLSTLRTFTLLGLLTNFKDIGTFIGEGAAKLVGYKDRTDELAQAERERTIVADAQRAALDAQAAANKAAIDRQFELSAAAKSSIAAFDDLVKGGKSAAQAVAEIGKDFDLSNAPGIVNAAAVLDKLAADGKISASEFSAAWGAALKGEDLQAFEAQARAALAGTARESERLAAIMDGTLREAIRRSGGDFEVLSGGMSKAARSAINDLDTVVSGMERLKAQGVDVGQALELSLGRAIKAADSQAAVEALRARVEQLRKQLGDPVANGLLQQVEEQAKKAAGGVTELDGALRRLGVTSDRDLKRAAAETRGLFEEVRRAGGSAREQALAFERMAAAAVASGDAGALAFVRSQAAAQGFEVATDAAGKTVVRAMMDAAAATDEAGDAANRAAGGYRNVARDAEAAAESARRLAEFNNRFSAPDGKFAQTGNTREERLQGQNAVDDTLRLDLVNKLNSGKLTQADAGDVKAFGAALAQNLALAQDATPGAISTDFLRSIREMQAQLIRMQQVLGAGRAGETSGVGGASTTHNVNIVLQGRTTTVNAASASDAAALSQFLAGLQDAASRA